MRVVFLDRDGVINKYPGDRDYVKNWQEFSFLPGSIEAIRLFNDNGFKVFVISNQAGVSKGIYSQQALDDITSRMLKEVEEKGAHIDGVYYCLHTDSDNCSCRKPKTGLLEEAVEQLGEKPEVCFFVGDSFRDMEAARKFGCYNVLVLSGKESMENRDKWPFHPDYVLPDLLSAAKYICGIRM